MISGAPRGPADPPDPQPHPPRQALLRTRLLLACGALLSCGGLLLACSNSAPPPPDTPRGGTTTVTAAPSPDPSAIPSASPSESALSTGLAPAPTLGPGAVSPARGLSKGVTCDSEGARCPEDHPICAVRSFSRCFGAEDLRREYPTAPGLPPILEGPCGDERACPPDRPYCISDAVTGCVTLDEGTRLAASLDARDDRDLGVYGQCTIASDCARGQTCCRGVMGLGLAACQRTCDFGMTQIHCAKDADCAPLRALCADKACRDRVRCEGTSLGFLQVCVGAP